MQGNLNQLLADKGIKMEIIESDRWEHEETIYRISDSERLIFLIELQDIVNLDLEIYVNKLMEWVTYEQASIEQDIVEQYEQITMRKILWDLYVIFVCYLSETNHGLLDEEIYSKQRDPHFMKRYIVQGSSDREIADKICFIVKPEKKIDDFINRLDFGDTETEHCRRMCHTKEGEGFGYDFTGETYNEIVTVLKKINGESFGEKTNEDTGS